MESAAARTDLVRTLQLAYSGELGAIRAYLGHRAALREPAQREALAVILKDEIRHRRCVLAMLESLGAAPDARAERRVNRIGRAIAFICHVGGWFIPMYGAARLESANIVEYEVAARLAWYAGCHELIEELLHMAEVEWDHELTLRSFAETHWLWRISPRWAIPAPRATIRERFGAFTAEPTPPSRGESNLFR